MGNTPGGMPGPGGGVPVNLENLVDAVDVIRAISIIRDSKII